MPMVLLALAAMLALAACGGADNRYRDTEFLERPPQLLVGNEDAAACCEDEVVIPDTRKRRGLRDAVNLQANRRPMAIIIKQPFDQAWNSVGLALAQSEIKVTDQQRREGVYYVAYQPASLFGAWLGGGEPKTIYQLNLTGTDGGTRVTASLAHRGEQGDGLQFEDDIEEARADAEDLLYRLYETLRDDLDSP